MRGRNRDRGFMSPALVRALRRFAHGRKGLDEETYRLHLQAVGAHSTLQLTREQHRQLIDRLTGLPDRPRRESAGGAR